MKSEINAKKIIIARIFCDKLYAEWQAKEVEVVWGEIKL